VPSRERLHLYAESLRGFWKSFRRNRTGITGVLIIVIFALMAIVPPFFGVSQENLANKASILGVRPYQKPYWLSYLDPGQSRTYSPINDSFSNGIQNWTLHIKGDGVPITTGKLFNSGGYNNSGYYQILYNHSDNRTSYNNTLITFEKQFRFSYRNSWGIVPAFARNITIFNPGSSLITFTLNITNPQGQSVSIWPIFGENSPNPTNTSGWEYFPLVLALNSYDPLLLDSIFTGPGNYNMQFSVNIQNTVANETVKMLADISSPALLLIGEGYGILGTDFRGWDLFDQFLLGTRVSFLVGIISAVVLVILGLLVGLFAGYIGGVVEETLMRIVDFILILPGLPLLIVLAFLIGGTGGRGITIWTIILVLAFLGWPGTARVIRSQVLTVKERSYVESARALGASRPYIMFRHILPNVLGLVYVLLATSVGGAIVTEAALSFLGLGDVSLISWGQMLAYAESNGAITHVEWWWIVPPGLGIALLSVSFIFIGHALDEVFNPRLRRR
jgi:ABC-type dipeptide/oligopeptide/nickel transport system permease subunit